MSPARHYESCVSFVICMALYWWPTGQSGEGGTGTFFATGTDGR